MHGCLFDRVPQDARDLEDLRGGLRLGLGLGLGLGFGPLDSLFWL